MGFNPQFHLQHNFERSPLNGSEFDAMTYDPVQFGENLDCMHVSACVSCICTDRDAGREGASA